MGILDALYSGVSIVGIPLFADQFSNTNFIVQNGCGLELQFDQLADENIVYDTLTTILEDQKWVKSQLPGNGHRSKPVNLFSTHLIMIIERFPWGICTPRQLKGSRKILKDISNLLTPC